MTHACCKQQYVSKPTQFGRAVLEAGLQVSKYSKLSFSRLQSSACALHINYSWQSEIGYKFLISFSKTPIFLPGNFCEHKILKTYSLDI